MSSERPIVTRCTTSDGVTLTVEIPDEGAFEALIDALDDPVWLVGATWQILTTNDFKRGRFEDAFGAWAERQAEADVRATMARAGVVVG